MRYIDLNLKKIKCTQNADQNKKPNKNRIKKITTRIKNCHPDKNADTMKLANKINAKKRILT